jgi:tetratricopeptide (TPR) repeat protein
VQVILHERTTDFATSIDSPHIEHYLITIALHSKIQLALFVANGRNMDKNTLVIRHVSSDPNCFMVIAGVKTSQPVEIGPPESFKVEGRPNSNLTLDLRWYLEDFLTYPFHPDTDKAHNVQDCLAQWGESAFKALFDNLEGGGMLRQAMDGHYKNLNLIISSDDPGVLSWPWEALRDPQIGYLVHACQMGRRIDSAADPAPISEKLPKDRLNILMVTARPYENDVRYRSISRLVVDQVEKQGLPAEVHILRPPTFDNLRNTLRANPDFFHVVHFDGHGAYGSLDGPVDISGGYQFKSKNQGCLIFENEKGEAEPIKAGLLSDLLREYSIPMVVLNACQSAMIDENAGDQFASVASALVRAGCSGVTAMAWSLYVSGAHQFLPAFYSRLFETGSLAHGVRAGRRQMLAKPDRVCSRGEFPLDDWLVPVVYQQQDLDFSFKNQGKEQREKAPLPQEINDASNPFGFVGRDAAILEMERRLHKEIPAILIHGIGGAGKTTLAKGFVKWLADTHGLGAGCFWFAFNDIRSAEYVINDMGEKLFGGNFRAASLEDRIKALWQEFKKHRYIIVWDNFESVCGIPGTEVKPMLPEQDRQLLKDFLQGLRGAPTKVIITSRSTEDWLKADRKKLGIRGLAGEELWELVNAVQDHLGLKIDRKDEDIQKLMDLLGGHPLAMRVTLPLLEDHTPGQLMEAINQGRNIYGRDADEATAKFYSTMEMAVQTLPKDLQPLLIPLGLHEKYFMIKQLEAIAQRVDSAWTRERLDAFCRAMVHLGMLSPLIGPFYELHPALTGYLRCVTQDRKLNEEWQRAFVDILARIADAFASKPLPDQRMVFNINKANFYHAMALAQQLETDLAYLALVQALALHAQNIRNFGEGKTLFEQLASAYHARGTIEGEAVAYHQLGLIAQEARNFSAAIEWYEKSLDIKEKQCDEHGAAISYHQLGIIAQEQRVFLEAEKWLKKALGIFEIAGNELSFAASCHQLGIVAQEQRDFQAAKTWYMKSLKIEEKQGVEHSAAITYHQLGIIAQKEGDFQEAVKWCKKALGIQERKGNNSEISNCYHLLGTVLLEQGDFSEAEKCYKRCLNIDEKIGNELGLASSYHQLGVVSQAEGDFEAAEKWYKKAVDILEKYYNEHDAAQSYGQLGVLHGLQKKFESSGRWFIKSIKVFVRTNDLHEAQKHSRNFMITYLSAPAAMREKLEALWKEAGLPDLSEKPEEGDD